MNVTLLRTSFDLLSPRAQELVDTFYALLFERFPSVKPMFAHTNLAKQKGMLIQALAFVVANLERPGALKEALGQMGRRHQGYGATPEQYGAVGECLLDALEHVAGPLWTAELHREWAGAYHAVAELMQATPETAPLPAPV